MNAPYEEHEGDNDQAEKVTSSKLLYQIPLVGVSSPFKGGFNESDH